MIIIEQFVFLKSAVFSFFPPLEKLFAHEDKYNLAEVSIEASSATFQREDKINVFPHVNL